MYVFSTIHTHTHTSGSSNAEQEDLTPESVVKVLEGLARGEHVKPGPQNGRLTSAPDNKNRTLTEEVCNHRFDTTNSQPYGPGKYCVPDFA